MAIVSEGGVLWIPRPEAISLATPVFDLHTMNASGEKFACIIRAPKAGTLDWFEYRMGTVVNAPDNGLRFSFQTVDLTTGFPDGTQDQFRDVTSGISSGAWMVPPGVMTDDGTGGGVKRTVTQDELFACVIDFVTFVAADDVRISSLDLSGTGHTATEGYCALNSGTWGKLFDAGNLALKYSDGTYGILDTPWYPMSAITARTFNSGSTPDERGLRFQVRSKRRLRRAWFRIDLDANADVVVYNAADGVLSTSSLDSDVRPGTSACHHIASFPDAPTLEANTTYRVVVKPTSGSDIVVYDFDVNAAALMAAVEGGAEWYSTTRTNGGAWTDTNTNRMFCGLGFDGLDVVTAGGLLVHPGMGGGLSA